MYEMDDKHIEITVDNAIYMRNGKTFLGKSLEHCV